MAVTIDRLSSCRGEVVLLEWFTDLPVAVTIDRLSSCRGVVVLREKPTFSEIKKELKALPASVGKP